MHRFVAGGKKKWISGGIALTLTAAITGTAIYYSNDVAFARPSLVGVESIVNDNSKVNPYKILEIVPDYSYARIGYTIAGEEPGDLNTGDALSDMATETERNARFMQPGTETTGTQPYVDLVTTSGDNGAFTYAPYQEDKTTILETTPGARAGAIFGIFIKNETNTGNYKSADTTGVYGQVGVDPVEKPITIQDVIDKVEGTDQTGNFYMDYVSFTRNGGDDQYELTFRKAGAAELALKPFYVMDVDGFKFYNDFLYVKGQYYTATMNENLEYILEEGVYVEEGQVVYVDGGSGEMEYFGIFKKDASDQLVFEDASGIERPIEGADDSDTFAEILYGRDAVTEYTSVREYTVNDGALDKYYISGVSAGSAANRRHYTANLNEKAMISMEGADPSVYGIVDESETGWYHTWWYRKAALEPYIYVGDKAQEYDFYQDYTLEQVNSFFYTGGYTNNEWFKREVLDVDPEKYADICIDVETKLLSEVTASDVAEARLVYFAPGDYSSVGDLSYAAAKAILSGACGEEALPVILEYSVFKQASERNTADASNVDMRNMSMLGMLMLQGETERITAWLGDDNWKMLGQEALVQTYARVGGINALRNSGEDISHVNGSIFINDDLKVGPVFYKDFTTEYSEDKIDGFDVPVAGSATPVNYRGFKDVRDDINEELFYLGVANKDVNSFNKVISKATSVRHIINFGKRRVVSKNKLRILDIEPFYNREIEANGTYAESGMLSVANGSRGTTTLRNIGERDILKVDWVTGNLSHTLTAEDVSITGMGVREFDGKLEDLNASYDMIYIGMDTAYLNTKIENGVKTNQVVGNYKLGNGQETGYVYSHIGDYVSTTNMLSAPNANYYSSGSDITPDKLRELKAYVEAGYAVLLSGQFFDIGVEPSGSTVKAKINGISTRLDPNSYMHDFVQWCYLSPYMGKNVNITNNLDTYNNDPITTNNRSVADERQEFVKYLNISKLKVEVISQPPLYNKDNTADKTQHDYILMNNQGVYTLDFKVKLSSESAADTTNTTYDCKLYIDHDADGRYEAVEELNYLDIYDVTDESNATYMETNGNGKYELRTGRTYTVSREVPEGYVGLIPWKLVFYENGRVFEGSSTNDPTNLVRVAVQDYSAIRDRDDRPEVRILQLISHDGSGDGAIKATNLDLTSDQMEDLYKEVNDFKITVIQEPVSNFIRNDGTSDIEGQTTYFKGGDRLEVLCNEFDMIVLGFFDGYRFQEHLLYNTGDAAAIQRERDSILTIREYVASGRSVLFTHDLNSYGHDATANGTWTGWGIMANKYLRDIQGMDRYGMVNLNLQNMKYRVYSSNNIDYVERDLTPYNSVYEDNDRFNRINGLVRGDIDKYGHTASAISRYANYTAYGELANSATRFTNGGDSRSTNQVTRVNRGQITEYPFRIGSMEQDNTGRFYANEKVTVRRTHSQYYQLNMQTNYTDENYNDDVVVWYCLGDNQAGIDGSPQSASKIYTLNYNDAINNYYIYNKGNVTYTGAGHLDMDGDAYDEERKLFVNTLVAAYNAGVHAPYASYKADGRRNAVEIKSKTLPYDVALSVEDGENGFIGETVDIYFKSINNNLEDNKKPINTKYYVSLPSASGATLTVGDKYYKEIEPVSFERCTTENTGVAESAHELANGQIYKAEFRLADLLNGSEVHSRLNPVFYIRMSTETTLDVMNEKRELTVLPALDSMSPLKINFAELYDLR